MLWIPNSLWSRRKPEGYESTGENRVLLIFERIGQALCTASILLFTDYIPIVLEPWTTWFITSAGDADVAV